MRIGFSSLNPKRFVRAFKLAKKMLCTTEKDIKMQTAKAEEIEIFEDVFAKLDAQKQSTTEKDLLKKLENASKQDFSEEMQSIMSELGCKI